jgi:hypothetical protein
MPDTEGGCVRSRHASRAARRAVLDETSAKEGGVPVAIARPFPFPETTTALRPTATAVDSRRPNSLGRTPDASLPLLARIPDITIGPRPRNDANYDINAAGGSSNAGLPSNTGSRYRLDSAHASVAILSGSHPAKTRRAVKRRRQSTSNGLETLSASIRFAINAWEFLQPYQPALRTAAMFLLMAASSMSVMLMIGQHGKPSPAPPQPTADAAESAILTKPAASSAEAEHEPASPTTTVPTAIGPGGPSNHSPDPIAQWPAGVPVESAASAVDVNLPASGPPPRLRTDGALAARGPGAKHGMPLSYPTTPYPTPPNLPGMAVDSLPQVRMSEPAPAVARLRGDILESQPR